MDYLKHFLFGTFFIIEVEVYFKEDLVVSGCYFPFWEPCHICPRDVVGTSMTPTLERPQRKGQYFDSEGESR